jgi:hypothetical protein
MLSQVKKVGSSVSNAMGNSWVTGLAVLALVATLVVGGYMYMNQSCPAAPACATQPTLVPGVLETKTIETTKQTLVTDKMAGATAL